MSSSERHEAPNNSLLLTSLLPCSNLLPAPQPSLPHLRNIWFQSPPDAVAKLFYGQSPQLSFLKVSLHLGEWSLLIPFLGTPATFFPNMEKRHIPKPHKTMRVLRTGTSPPTTLGRLSSIQDKKKDASRETETDSGGHEGMQPCVSVGLSLYLCPHSRTPHLSPEGTPWWPLPHFPSLPASRAKSGGPSAAEWQLSSGSSLTLWLSVAAKCV